MTLRLLLVGALVSLAFVGAVDYFYKVASEGERVSRWTKGSESPSASRSLRENDRGVLTQNRPRSYGGSAMALSYRAGSSSLPSLPTGAKVLEVEQEESSGLRETIVKLETGLTPIELSTFYTDELVEDWIIYRDTLTEETGWSGVFLQYGDIERRLGVFGVVKSRGVGATGGTVTAVSMLLVETRS